MVDMRRRGPEPPWAGPEIEYQPGKAPEKLRELAPRLAEDGIHVDEPGELSDVDVPDMQTLQRALDRAVERQNLALFTPTGTARDLAAAALAVLPASLRRSLTWDLGSEMALHAPICQELGMPVFFCEKASPWQRPSNENTNGLLRQYFPKGTDLRVHSLEQLVAVAAELNARPRKTLGWATPAQRLANLEATAT